jgi:alpha-tubulin suppressor-like RCC1 family protein
MENYYRKYKLSSLYFGAYHSGQKYYFPANTLSEIEFNRFKNPYYVQFLDLPKTGIISLFNYLEPIYNKFNQSGSDKVFTLPTRTDTINVKLKKIQDIFLENISTRNLNASINYFGNDLEFVYSTYISQIIVKGAGTATSDGVYTRSNNNQSFNGSNGFISFNGSIWNLYDYSLNKYTYKSPPSNYSGPTPGPWIVNNALSPIPSVEYITSTNKANLSANEWSNEEDLVGLINNLNFSYLGNVNNGGNFIGFTGKGHFLKNCSGCADVATLTTKTSGDPNIFCKEQYVEEFSVDIEYNPYNLISEIEKNVIVNSEKINLSKELASKIFINSEINNNLLSGIFKISTITGNEVSIRDDNHLPLFFRTLNLNSKKLLPIVDNDYIDGDILNENKNITSYRYVPNVDSQKVFGSRIINEKNILGPKKINMDSYSKKIYNTLYSGTEVYEYAVEENSNIPQQQQNTEGYFKYNDIYQNSHLIERRPVQTRLEIDNSPITFLKLPLPSGSLYSNSVSINGSGNVFLVTAPNATVNNLKNVGLVTVHTGLGFSNKIVAKITGSNSSTNDNFGFSSCINQQGNIFAIGAPFCNINNISGAGAVYIFTGDGNKNWSQVKILTANPVETGSQFGISLAMNSVGNVLAVGENKISGASGISGAVYIFTGQNNNWEQYNKIYKPISNPINASDTGNNNFGFSIAINHSGNKIVIGAPTELQTGAVYIFTGDSYKNKNWLLSGKINSTITNNNNTGDLFGYSLSMNSGGNIFSIGAPGFINDAGFCAVIEENNPNANFFTGNQQYKGNFGFSHALNSTGNFLTVAAPFATIISNNVNKFSRAGIINNFINLTGWKGFSYHSNLQKEELFGFSIDVDNKGTMQIIGAPKANDYDNQIPSPGIFYVSADPGIYISQDAHGLDYNNRSLPLYDENPIEEYTIPNIKVQLDSSDRYSIPNVTGPAATLWKNKVNFFTIKYDDLTPNSGDAVTFYSNINLIDGTGQQPTGILIYNNPNTNDYISISGKTYTYPNDFSNITGLRDLLNTGNYSTTYRIYAEILNNNTLLLKTSGENNSIKSKIEVSEPIKTNYVSGQKKFFSFGNAKYELPNFKEKLFGTTDTIKNIYGSKFQETDTMSFTYGGGLVEPKDKLDDFYLFLLNNHKVTGVGRNTNGRLFGSNSNNFDDFFTGNYNTSPVGILTGVSGISIGRNFALALLNNGKITGWGENMSGQVAGTTGNISNWQLTPVGALTGVNAISAGRVHSLALLNNGKITGWGDNTFGQVAGTTIYNNANEIFTGNWNITPAANITTNAKKISAGWAHSLLVYNPTNKITGWGDNTYNQALGGNSLTKVSEISAGHRSSLATISGESKDGRVTGWGNSPDVAQLHPLVGTYSLKYSNIKKIQFSDLDGGSAANVKWCLLSGDGKLALNTITSSPVNPMSLTNISDISMGASHVLALLNNGRVTGWGGYTSEQQASRGNNITGVTGISAGYNTSLALLNNGKVTGWGSNTFGQVSGTTEFLSNWEQCPVAQITGAKKVIVSIAGYYSFALLNDGTVTGWGDDSEFRVSDGLGLTGVKDISLGYIHGLALLNNGKVTGWGNNDYDQAFGGNSLTGVSGISAGALHNLALLKNGKVTGWGYIAEEDIDGYIAGGNLTGVVAIEAGNNDNYVIMNDSNLPLNNYVTGWGPQAGLDSQIFNSATVVDKGPNQVSGINAGIFYSSVEVNNNTQYAVDIFQTGKVITNYGYSQFDFNNIDFFGDKTNSLAKFKKLKKYQTAYGTKSFIVLTENESSGSMYMKNYENIFSGVGLDTTSDVIRSVERAISFGYLTGAKYSYSLTGSGFFDNAIENYPVDDSLLPEYQNIFSPSVYFSKFSTMIITGYSASLPVSIFFVEDGSPNSFSRTIQSYNKTGCYISIYNTGKLINLTGIGEPTKINEPLYNKIEIGNLIMDTSKFEYYINNKLIFSGATGFNFGQILLGNNSTYNSPQPTTTFNSDDEFDISVEDLTGINQGIGGHLFEVLIYDSGLNTLNRNEVYSYLRKKWNNLNDYYNISTSELTNNFYFPLKTKNNCSDCFPQLNTLPKENEPHVLLLEYNLYGFPETDIDGCDMDLNVHILKTGFYEESKKEPITSNLSINYVSGREKSISAIGAKSQNIYNVSDFNFGLNAIPPFRSGYNSLQSNMSLRHPIRVYATGDYLKYPKIDGNGV